MRGVSVMLTQPKSRDCVDTDGWRARTGPSTERFTDFTLVYAGLRPDACPSTIADLEIVMDDFVVNGFIADICLVPPQQYSSVDIMGLPCRSSMR